MPVPKPVDDNRMTIGQTLEPADEPQRVVGHVFRNQLPNGVALLIQFDGRPSFAACQQQMPIGQLSDFKRLAQTFQLAKELALVV
jgi:hypothetical protein